MANRSLLQFLPFLQAWDATRLAIRLLALPKGNPVDPLIPGQTPSAPSFATAQFVFDVRLVGGLDQIPTTATQSSSVTVPSPAPGTALYGELAMQYSIDPAPPPGNPRPAGTRIKKYLPPTYRNAVGFAAPRSPHTVTDDSFFCTIHSGSGKPPYKKIKPPADPKYPWGKVLAIVLRQPLLSQAIGLVRPMSIPVPADFFRQGGWVYVTLASTSDLFALTTTPGALRLYATRVPAISAVRPLFSPVFFPVADVTPAGPYDELFVEAEDYNDGFAKAVHATQPVHLDPLNEKDDGSRPAKDVGIRLGWDDEQVAIWLNRQIDPALAVLDAPMGVLGYRIDARVQGTTDWSSLCRATSTVKVGNTIVGNFDGELAIETIPSQPEGATTGVYWLSSYYTNWTGPSLVAQDRLLRQLLADPNANEPSPVTGVDPGVPLRYGTTYELRVRLMDVTGGGPDVGGRPSVPGPSPVFTLPFRRWIRPHAVNVVETLPNVPDPANAPNLFHVARPVLGYPEYVFTGAPNAAATLLADVPAAVAAGREVGAADPDVATLRITVEVLALGLDNAAGGGGDDGGFHKLFDATRQFPADLSTPLEVDLDWRDIHDADKLGPPPDSGPIPVPTGRDVRLVLTAVAKEDVQLEYFGADDVRFGPSISVLLRKVPQDERGLLLPEAPGDLLRAMFLQPDDVVEASTAFAQRAAGKGVEAPANAIGRLAEQLGLEINGLTLHGRAGRRVVFGAAAGLRHILAPDHSGITFSSNTDLTRHWIIALRATMDRDWTWDELAPRGFSVLRADGIEIGRIEPRRSINPDALIHAERSQTDLVFFDAVDPKPGPAGFPTELNLSYSIEATFLSPVQADGPVTVDVTLPMTTPPTQVPQIVAAGIALSPYARSSDYSQTDPRRRVLWLEFNSAVENPRDAYFARVLAYAPDPVLLIGPTDSEEEPEPPLPVDPEPIRTIIPGQSDDRAGLSAMQRLIPSDSPRHFIVPLPSGLPANTNELFGFFTYEFRVGHSDGWSTAQGRFGAALRISGVQHPAPPLTCAAVRDQAGLLASAPFANPVAEGRSLRPSVPATRLFIFLYAQVLESDSSDWRNVLLSQKEASPPLPPITQSNTLFGSATWTSDEIRTLLTTLTLGTDTPLSCLAAETMPAGSPAKDPLGASLGEQRILRTSPLVPIVAQCAVT